MYMYTNHPVALQLPSSQDTLVEMYRKADLQIQLVVVATLFRLLFHVCTEQKSFVLQTNAAC
jgi:hypothetical protein